MRTFATQIVALAGDFYGFPNRPISGDPTGQTFQDAFDSLARGRGRRKLKTTTHVSRRCANG